MVATYDAEIEQTVQAVFSTMANLHLRRVDPSFSTRNFRLVASIQITGDWIGTVTLGLCPALAITVAAAMLDIPAEDVTDADQQDVAAELVNIIGGNLKSLLPGSSKLSLPTVITGEQFHLHVPDAEMLDDVWMTAVNGIIRVTLFAKRVFLEQPV